MGQAALHQFIPIQPRAVHSAGAAAGVKAGVKTARTSEAGATDAFELALKQALQGAQTSNTRAANAQSAPVATLTTAPARSSSATEPKTSIAPIQIPIEALNTNSHGKLALSLDDLQAIVPDKELLHKAKKGEESLLVSLTDHGQAIPGLFNVEVKGNKAVLSKAFSTEQSSTKSGPRHIHKSSIRMTEYGDAQPGIGLLKTPLHAPGQDEPSLAANLKSGVEKAETSMKQPMSRAERVARAQQQHADLIKAAAESALAQAHTDVQQTQRIREAAVNQVDKESVSPAKKAIDRLHVQTAERELTLTSRREGEIQLAESKPLKADGVKTIEQNRRALTEVKEALHEVQTKNQRFGATGAPAESVKTPENPATLDLVKMKMEADANDHMVETARGAKDDVMLKAFSDAKETRDAAKPQTEREKPVNHKAEDERSAQVKVKTESTSQDSNQRHSSDDQSNQSGDQFKRAMKAATDQIALGAMSNKATRPMEKEKTSDEPVRAQALNAQNAAAGKAADTAQAAKVDNLAQSASMQERVDQAQQASEQIVKSVKGMISDGKSQVTLQLHPESLGKVSIQLTMDHGALTAHFTAHKDSTRAMLENHMAALRTALDDQNVKVDRLHIQKDSMDMRQQQEQNRDQSRENRMAQERGSFNQSGGRSGEQRRNGQGWNWSEYWTSWRMWRS